MLMRRRLTQPLVESWFDLLPAGQQTLARDVHSMILALAPGLDLSVRSGHLVYGVERQHVLALAPHRQHLHLQIFAGSALAARFPALEGTGPGLRQLRLRYAQPADMALVNAIVTAATQSAPARRGGLPTAHAQDNPAGEGPE
jgi:hypothetical protein